MTTRPNGEVHRHLHRHRHHHHHHDHLNLNVGGADVCDVDIGDYGADPVYFRGSGDADQAERASDLRQRFFFCPVKRQ